MKERELIFKSLDGIELSGTHVPAPTGGEYVLLAHGITADRDEYGNFHRHIAEELYEVGIGSFRFDFRGHGDSGLSERETTVLGQLLDLKAAYSKLTEKDSVTTLSIVASSFGAPPSVYFTEQYESQVKTVVLLCPVLDYTATFLDPIVPWAKDSFNEEGMRHLKEYGYLVLDDAFDIGAEMVEEFRYLNPIQRLNNLDTPVLSLHGEDDTKVPPSVTKEHGEPNARSQFQSIPNAGHGFTTTDEVPTDTKRREVINKVTNWIDTVEE